MKCASPCLKCLLSRAYQSLCLATNDAKRRREAMEAVTELIGKEFSKQAVPAVIGNKRERLIQKITGCKDYYSELKKRSNLEALKVLPTTEKYLEEEGNLKEKFRRACLISIAGNVIEFGVLGHDFTLEEPALEEFIETQKMGLDRLDEAYDFIKKEVKNILFLTDNAGEIVLDILLVKTLKEINPGVNVVVGVKSGPIMNDATMEDAKVSGMLEIADEVIETGSSSIGLNLEECSEEFIEKYYKSELIVAKGMGHYETMTEFIDELSCSVLFLFKAKCEPVAKHVGVEKGKGVALFIK